MNENYNKNIYSVSDISNIDLARDNEFKLFIDLALLKYFKGNFTKAAMLSCYAHMFKKHKLNPFICEDSFLAQLYEKNISCIEKNKKELKDEGFITTERKGLDPKKYITVNMEKVFEIYKNFGEQKSSEFLAGAYPHKITGTEPNEITGGIYNNDNIIKKYNNINAREGDFSRVEDNNNPIQNFENNINRKSNYLKVTVQQQEQNKNISSEAKEENKEPWEKYPAFMKLWNNTPEFSKGCGIAPAFNEWLIETENGTNNVEEIYKGLMFHFKTTPKDIKTKHLTKLLMYVTWRSFLFEAIESEKKKQNIEEARKERKTKEEQVENLGEDNDFATLYKKMTGVDLLQKIKDDEEKQNEHYR